MSTVMGPPFGQIEQVHLESVNTDLATLLGFETDAEYQLARWRSVFLRSHGARNINFVERFSKPFRRIGNPGYQNTK